MKFVGIDEAQSNRARPYDIRQATELASELRPAIMPPSGSRPVRQETLGLVRYLLCNGGNENARAVAGVHKALWHVLRRTETCSGAPSGTYGQMRKLLRAASTLPNS